MTLLRTILLGYLVAGPCPVRAGNGHAADAHSEVRGMTVSVPTWGWEWGTDEMAQTLDVLADLGVNWVAIHPYARIRNDGGVDWQVDGDEVPIWIARPIQEAHARGIKVLIKPHLAYWGSQFAWRGDIKFDDEAQWKRFFQEYTGWIESLAALSTGADAFAIGTELDQTSHRPEWTGVIQAARQFDGHLTYASNWDGFADIPFWHLLDVIGIQAYFPLADAAGQVPTALQLEQRWRPVMDRIRTVHLETGKPVVFTELGYNRSAYALAEPWSSHNGGANSEALQQLGLDVALRMIASEPAVTGAFLWKWFPGEQAIGNFRMSRPAIREIISQRWRKQPEQIPQSIPVDRHDLPGGDARIGSE